jgi:hypothetical protein
LIARTRVLIWLIVAFMAARVAFMLSSIAELPAGWTRKRPDLTSGKLVAAGGRVIVQFQAPNGALAGNTRCMLSRPYASCSENGVKPLPWASNTTGHVIARSGVPHQ